MNNISSLMSAVTAVLSSQQHYIINPYANNPALVSNQSRGTKQTPNHRNPTGVAAAKRAAIKRKNKARMK